MNIGERGSIRIEVTDKIIIVSEYVFNFVCCQFNFTLFIDGNIVSDVE